jgi:hypothetical protein
MISLACFFFHGNQELPHVYLLFFPLLVFFFMVDTYLGGDIMSSLLNSFFGSTEDCTQVLAPLTFELHLVLLLFVCFPDSVPSFDCPQTTILLSLLTE